MCQDLRNTEGLKSLDMAYTINPHLGKVRRDAVRLVKYRGKSMREVARHVGVEPSTISRWCRRDQSGGWKEIPTRSSAPKTHPNALAKEVVTAIIAKRMEHRRCGQVVHQELKKEGMVVSLSSVQRTLQRTHLRKERSPWKRPHDATPRPKVTKPGALVQTDTVHFILPDSSRLYVYTLIDLFSRWAYAEVAEKISAQASVEFVHRAQATADFLFDMVQTDHGTEFSTWFTHGLWLAGFQHRHSRVRQSNDNAHIERFNRTVQEECLDHTAHTLRDFGTALAGYLPYYNGKRLHMGINYQTPLEVLQRC
jgi:transposase InsO family protein